MFTVRHWSGCNNKIVLGTFRPFWIYINDDVWYIRLEIRLLEDKWIYRRPLSPKLFMRFARFNKLLSGLYVLVLRYLCIIYLWKKGRLMKFSFVALTILFIFFFFSHLFLALFFIRVFFLYFPLFLAACVPYHLQ